MGIKTNQTNKKQTKKNDKFQKNHKNSFSPCSHRTSTSNQNALSKHFPTNPRANPMPKISSTNNHRSHNRFRKPTKHFQPRKRPSRFQNYRVRRRLQQSLLHENQRPFHLPKFHQSSCKIPTILQRKRRQQHKFLGRCLQNRTCDIFGQRHSGNRWSLTLG